TEAMENAISQVNHRLDRFIAEYKPTYWPHVVEQLMRETADQYHGWNYGVIADKVKDALETIYTTVWQIRLSYQIRNINPRSRDMTDLGSQTR
ncbi:hypothetical protein PRIPAC_84920, partial [Pristionchus pacificus]